MRIKFAAKWAMAVALFALSITTGIAEPLYPANVDGNDKITGRVEVYNLNNTRLPASSVFRCNDKGCEFVKLSIIVKPPEVQIIQNMPYEPDTVPVPGTIREAIPGAWYY